MPLEVQCPQCSSKFRAAEKYAGKRVKCPKCQGVIAIPNAVGPGGETPEEPASKTPSKPAPDKPTPSKPTPEKPKSTPKGAPAASNPSPEKWYMQTEDGQKFGPVSRQELDHWAAEGRLDSSCQLLREGGDQWQWAEEIYPELAESQEEPHHPTEAQSENPFAGIGEPAPTAGDVNPFASPQESGMTTMGPPASDGDSQLTPRIFQALAQTRPWVLFLSILGFIGAGLGAIASLIYGAITLLAMSAIGPVGAILGIGALIMVATAVLYFFASYYLFRYSSEIARLLRTRASLELERALIAQKSFWKLTGIVTAVVVSLYLLLLLLALALGIG